MFWLGVTFGHVIVTITRMVDSYAIVYSGGIGNDIVIHFTVANSQLGTNNIPSFGNTMHIHISSSTIQINSRNNPRLKHHS